MKALFAAAALALAGCAAVEQPLRGNLEAPSEVVRGCAAWFESLDGEVVRARVRDAQDAPIAGFPYLRASRLLVSLRDAAGVDQRALHAWADRLLALDVAARRHEIANLPRQRLAALPEQAENARRDAVIGRTLYCGRLLRELDLAKPEARDALTERAQVPDDYSSMSRVLGAYALSKYLFADGVRRYEEETQAAFRAELAVPEGGVVVRYSPPGLPRPARATVAAAYDRAKADPLGIPEPSDIDLESLFAAHAPVFEIEITGDYDRFGALRWLPGSAVPQVDATDLAVYRHAAWTRYRGRTLLQLVYTIWFPERPPVGEGDILAGKLDGLTWRVTLAPDGEPLVYDSIHPCGCFHMFFPTRRAAPLPPPDGIQEWMFAPQALRRVAEDERIVLRVATRTHALIRVTAERGATSLAHYALRPYDELRSLVRAEGGWRSVFDPDGLVAGTERPERQLFWPMGVASAGAMRQWGRHATAFVGRRHFDDADLLEKRFLLDFE